MVLISLREMCPYGLDGPLGGGPRGFASPYAIGSPARLSSDSGRTAFQAMTLRKLVYHRLLTLRYLMSYTDAQFAWFSLVFT